jgi:hypothetical protein
MKVIYDTVPTKVPATLQKAVRKAYDKRKPNEPKLRVIDVWKELEQYVKSK